MTGFDGRRGSIGGRLTARTENLVVVEWTHQATEGGPVVPWTPTGPASIWVGGSLSPDPTDLEGATEFPDTGGGAEDNETTHVITTGAGALYAMRATVDGVLVGLGKLDVSSTASPVPEQRWTAQLGEVRATFILGGPPGPKGDDGDGGGAVASVDGRTGTVTLGDLYDAAGSAQAVAVSLADVATSGSYTDLDDTPTLGTAAAEDTTAFATSEQGETADSALQPGDLSATGIASYDAGVIDVPASAVEEIADTAAADAIMDLREAADSDTIVTDDSAEGLLRWHRASGRRPTPGLTAIGNTTDELSFFTSAQTIDARLGDTVAFVAGAAAQNNSGGTETMTLRVKLGGTTVWTWTVDLPPLAGNRAWRLSLEWQWIDFGGNAAPAGCGTLNVAGDTADLLTQTRTAGLAFLTPGTVELDFTVQFSAAHASLTAVCPILTVIPGRTP